MDFQCFYLDWYPELNIGNVFFSSKDNTISQYKNVQNGHDLAFYSFLDWLFFYLEDFETG